MVLATDNSWTIPDVKSDEVTGVCFNLKLPFRSKELEIIEKSIDNFSTSGSGFCDKKRKPISKIFRDAYQPSLEVIQEVDDEEIAEAEVKFDLTLSAIHRERALNAGCLLKNESRKYRKKKYKKVQVERRPRSQTV